LIVPTLRPAIFDCCVVPFNIANFAQPFAESSREVGTRICYPLIEKPNHRYRRLLRTRRKRPPCRAAQ
jgi:hypothetical protein